MRWPEPHPAKCYRAKAAFSYPALKRRFDLDDEYLEDLKAELIKAEGVAADEGGEVLVWVGNW